MRGEAQPRQRQLTRHYFPLAWLLITSLAGFGVFVAWDTGLLGLVYRFDRSHIALVITGLAVVASGHAAWHIVLFSDRIALLAAILEGGDRTSAHAPHDTSAPSPPNTSARSSHDTPARSSHDSSARSSHDDFIDALLTDLAEAQPGPSAQPTIVTSATAAVPVTAPGTDTGSIIEIHADRLRSPVDLGWYLVDLAVRLGLIGTIVGFILIFTSLSDSSVSGAEGIKDLLVSMSSGMGTALFTTLTGLIAASLLSVQYLILGRETETLVGLMLRLRGRRENRSPPARAAQPPSPDSLDHIPKRI